MFIHNNEYKGKYFFVINNDNNLITRGAVKYVSLVSNGQVNYNRHKLY